MKTVAIVECDTAMAHFLEEVCRTSGYEIVGCACDAPAAIAMIEKKRPDCLLLGFNLGKNGNGLDVIASIKERHPSIFTVMITAWDINDIASKIGNAQPDRIMRKPVHMHTLVKVLAGAEGLASTPVAYARNMAGR
jgi:DNA-binding NarL/FixJ family response regulator